MLTKQIKATTGYSTMAPADVLVRAVAAYDGLNGNPSYSNLPVDLPTFKTAIDGFSSAIAEALDGGKKAILERDQLQDTMTRMLRQLGHHVEANCMDDINTFVSSGFQPASTARTAAQPLSEAIRKITQGPNSGQLLVQLIAVKGARCYELRWAADSAGVTPGAWTTQLLGTVKPAAVIAGLTPGTVYAVQVRAFVQSGYTDWSDSATRMCT